jgi:hypothetical protein
MDSGRPPCVADDQCAPGVCVAGACCGSADQACGSDCCDGAGEVCFASACVVPGDVCRTDADCAAGEYCEPGLGMGGDAGVGGDGGVDGGRTCLGGTPPPGRCLTLPPRCATDPPPPGEVCIRDCEYRPPPGGALDAIPEWTWGQGTAREYPGRVDVWSTPAVGRVSDTNCDGVVGFDDPPNVVFVSGNATASCCHMGCGGRMTNECITGALRVLDGATGVEVWTSRFPEAMSVGYAGVSVALANADSDSGMEIFAATGEGRIALLDNDGSVVAVSMARIPEYTSASFGWGGALSVADADGDGTLEIAYGRTMFRWNGTTIDRVFVGTGGLGGSGIASDAISFFVELDGMPGLELLAGRTAYRLDGTVLWDRPGLPDSFSAAADFDGDAIPEVAFVASGQIYVLDGRTGATELGPLASTAMGNGGPPTIADFDGDGDREIGVAFQNYYVVADPDYTTMTMDVLWRAGNHDFSSSVTGSTVFDFEGDGAAEVIYNDECFLWVYDGTDGTVRFAGLTTSFTATEASLVADVDGDGSAEIVMVSNGADPATWTCNVAPWTSADGVRPGWVAPPGYPTYRGITVFGDRAGSWVGTRMLWNQHAYSVSNVCDDRDDACMPPLGYGAIPRAQRANWTVPWLNNFRQNVQDQGIFDAPDAIVTLEVMCTMPELTMVASVRNVGEAILPGGVDIGFYQRGTPDTILGTGTTGSPIFPGQVAQVRLSAPAGLPLTGSYFARIEIDPTMRTFRECREDNNDSPDVTPRCLE